MKPALLELITSKKFLTTLTTIIVYLAGRFGFDVDIAMLDRVCAALFIYIGAQGIADHGKAAAKLYIGADAASAASRAAATGAPGAVDPRSRASVVPAGADAGVAGAAATSDEPPSARMPTSAATIAALACIVLATASVLPACAGMPDAGAKIAGEIIDCTAGDRRAVVAQFEPVLEQLLINATSADGKEIDWTSIKAASKALATDLGGCALASAVGRLLNPPPPKPGAPASAALELDPAALRAGFNALRVEQFGGVAFHTASGNI